MSFSALAWALEQEIPKASAKLLLIALAHYANDHDCFDDVPKDGQYAWPSRRLLARDCSTGERNIKILLTELEHHGFISRIQRFDATGRSLPNLYRLSIPSYDSPSPRGKPDSPQGESGDPQNYKKNCKKQTTTTNNTGGGNAGSPSPLVCDAVKAWNDIVHHAGGQKCFLSAMKGRRRESLLKVLKEVFENDISEWRRYLQQVASHDWWCGRAPASRYKGKPMRINIDHGMRYKTIEMIKNDVGFGDHKQQETLSQRMGGL